MVTKVIRCLCSLVLGFGLFIGAVLPGAGMIPVQAAPAIQLQWVQNYDPIPGTAANSGFGRALAESADGSIIVIGIDNETVGANAGQGAVQVLNRTRASWGGFTLHASDGGAGDHFGSSVAISGNGSTILVGAYQDTVSGHAKQGSAYVFVWSGLAWTQQVKLYSATGAATNFFGTAVALSNDGSTALIGAYGFTVSKSNQGAAFVFTRSGTIWTQQTATPIIAPDAVMNDGLGNSVSLSSDGNTALVAASNVSSNQGAAYAYVRSGTSWYFQHKIAAWDGAAGDDFGRSVSLGSNGNVALIGADNAPAPASLSGAAYTFSRSGSVWSNGVKLTAPDAAASDWFGYSVSLSADGSTAAVGSILADINGVSAEGAAYVFYGPGFSQEQKLVASSAHASDNIGAAIAISGDGSMVMVGSPNFTFGAVQCGGVYIFDRFDSAWQQLFSRTNAAGKTGDDLGRGLAVSSDGSTAIVGSSLMETIWVYKRILAGWYLQATIPSNDPNSFDFGARVAISGDGNTALIGAPDAGGPGYNTRGAAYLLTRTGSSWSAPTKVLAPDGIAHDSFGSSVALSADGATAAIGADTANFIHGSAYVMVRSGGVWSTPARLEPSDGAYNDFFGSSIALSGDGSTLLVGAPSTGVSKTGAAYVFVRSSGVYSQLVKWSDSTFGSRYFGESVALSADGAVALIGAPLRGSGENGMAYFYVRSSGVWAQQVAINANDFAPGDGFGSAVSLSADGSRAVVGAEGAVVEGSLLQGAAYVYNRSAPIWATWDLQSKLTSSDGVHGDRTAQVVEMSADGHTVLFNEERRDYGGVYFFTDKTNYSVFLPIVKR